MGHKSRLTFAFLLTLLPVLLARTSDASPQSGAIGWGIACFDSHWNEEPFTSIAAGSSITAAIRANGSIAAWGFNYDGQCIVPALPPGLVYTQVSPSSSNPSTMDVHVLALRSDGAVIAWGGNAYGQCNVPALPAGVVYSAVSAGTSFSLALRSDGALMGWGNNQDGECSVPLAPSGLVFTAVASGETWGLALRSDGVVAAWGSSPAPVLNVPALPPGLTYVGISAGRQFGMALRSDGVAVAWGSNVFGQCSVPGLPPGMTYLEIGAGRDHALALRSDGALLAWGDNNDQECDVPAPPPGLTYVGIAAGEDHSVARRSDGIAVCWGSNERCQCNVPALPAGVSFSKIVARSYDYASPGGPVGPLADEYLGLRSDGQLSRWGPVTGTIPALPPGMTYTQIGPGVTFAAIRSDGALLNWNGWPAAPALPPGVTYVGIAGGESTGQEVSCGGGYVFYPYRVLACRSDGAIIPAWSNCLTYSCTPNPLPPGVSYDQVCTSGVHALGRRSDGSVIGWGDVSYGECTLPLLPPGVTYVDIAAGGGTYFEITCGSVLFVEDAHSLALRSDGLIEGSGSNYSGQLSVPALPLGVSYVEIAAGSGFSVARRSDGVVLAWGGDWTHQLEVPSLSPGESCAGIAAGTYSAAAIYEAAPPCGSTSIYCYPALPNSASAQGAQLTSEGCPGLTANNLVLDVSGLPPSRTGMFLYGSSQQQVSFGNGWGCVAGGIQRVLPAILSSPTGTVSCPVDLTQFPYTGSAHSILAGSAWNFQFWYRDPTAPPSMFNLSDGLHIAFAP